MTDTMVETVFGPVAVEATWMDKLEPGDVFAVEPDDTGVEAWPLYEVIQAAADHQGRLLVETVTPEFLVSGERGWFDALGEVASKVVATLYLDDDGCPDVVDGREVFDVGQVRFGGLLVCMLRDAADHIWYDHHDPQQVIDVFYYAIGTGLIHTVRDDPIRLTADGEELLETLDDIYPRLLFWRHHLETAAEL